jgi:hypothetical protein
VAGKMGPADIARAAQFLNVIESVFSGMSRAVIHNSDYASLDAAKNAIDLYFRERNEHFAGHPKRAGLKIWGKERVPCKFQQDQNCKDSRMSVVDFASWRMEPFSHGLLSWDSKEHKKEALGFTRRAVIKKLLQRTIRRLAGGCHVTRMVPPFDFRDARPPFPG